MSYSTNTSWIHHWFSCKISEFYLKIYRLYFTYNFVIRDENYAILLYFFIIWIVQNILRHEIVTNFLNLIFNWSTVFSGLRIIIIYIIFTGLGFPLVFAFLLKLWQKGSLKRIYWTFCPLPGNSVNESETKSFYSWLVYSELVFWDYIVPAIDIW